MAVSYGALPTVKEARGEPRSMWRTAAAIAAVSALCLVGVVVLVGSGAARPTVMPIQQYTTTTTMVLPPTLSRPGKSFPRSIFGKASINFGEASSSPRVGVPWADSEAAPRSSPSEIRPQACGCCGIVGCYCGCPAPAVQQSYFGGQLANVPPMGTQAAVTPDWTDVITSLTREQSEDTAEIASLSAKATATPHPTPQRAAPVLRPCIGAAQVARLEQFKAQTIPRLQYLTHIQKYMREHQVPLQPPPPLPSPVQIGRTSVLRPVQVGRTSIPRPVQIGRTSPRATAPCATATAPSVRRARRDRGHAPAQARVERGDDLANGGSDAVRPPSSTPPPPYCSPYRSA
jgi:hypothetical protein